MSEASQRHIPGWVTIKKDTQPSVFFCAHLRDRTRRLGGRQRFACLLTNWRPKGRQAKLADLMSEASQRHIPGWVTKRNKSELFRQSKLVRICFLL
jgi:ribosomal protein L39E